MERICSISRLVSDPNGAAEVLLDYKNPTLGEPTTPGGQQVQGVQYPGVQGTARFPRGNNERTL